MIDNRRLPVLGRADVPLQIQLMLDVSEGPGEECLVHWDRHLMLRDVWVVGMGESSPRDLYVSYADWAYDPSKPQPAAQGPAQVGAEAGDVAARAASAATAY